MKKNFLFLPLLGIACSTLLASCNSYLRVENDALIQVGAKEYTIKEIYDTQRDTKAAAESYYNLLNDVYTQLAIPVDAAMEADIDNQMETNFYQAARDNARTNSTTVKEEQEKLLQAANVDNVEEYRANLTLTAQKNSANDEYYSEENIKSSLLDEYLDKDQPYHVKHILVKTAAVAGEYHRATITADQAQKLGRVVMRLASGAESFGDVAHTASDDSGSAAAYGDLGIMDRNTSFVSEFKLGDFVWDMKYNGAVSAENRQTAIETLGPSETGYAEFETDLDEYTLFGIPFSSAIALTEMYDLEADETGHTPTNAEETNYPRNVIFNTYYNNHSMSLVFLSEEDMNSMQSVYSSYIGGDDVTTYGDYLNSDGLQVRTLADLGLTGQIKTYTPVLTKDAESGAYTFTYQLADVDADAKVLCDEQGNPILVTRAGNSSGSSDSEDESSSSYEGVHFIVNQRDPFQSYQTSTGADYPLSDYYNVDLTEALASADTNYLNYIRYSSNANYNTRVNGLTSAIQEEGLGSNNNSEFDVYENTKAQAEADGYTVNVPADIQTLVDSYIDSTKALNDYTNTNNYDRAWQTYIDKLDFQQGTVSLNLPLSSIDQFGNGNIPMYINLGTLSGDVVDYGTISATAFTNNQPTGTYGVDWIYNPAYVGTSAGLVID